jgi:hypothetical protein
MSNILWISEGGTSSCLIRLNSRLFDDHDRDIILDGVNAAAPDTLKAFAVCRQSHVRFAERAGEDFEKSRVKGHIPLLAGYSIPEAVDPSTEGLGVEAFLFL